jgi:hypothetical protein
MASGIKYSYERLIDCDGLENGFRSSIRWRQLDSDQRLRGCGAYQPGSIDHTIAISLPENLCRRAFFQIRIRTHEPARPGQWAGFQRPQYVGQTRHNTAWGIWVELPSREPQVATIHNTKQLLGANTVMRRLARCTKQLSYFWH